MSTEKPNHGKRTPAGRIGNIAKSRGLAGLITKAGTAAATTLGKLPPQATDLEEAVLGALMLEKDALTTVIEILTPESFYKDSHKEIYKAITELFDNSEPIDILTVTNQLRKSGKLEFVGGPFAITELTNRVNSAANIEYHARIVAEQAIKRELINIASEIEKEAYEDTTDVFNLLDLVEQKIFNVSESNIRKNYVDMRSLMREAISELEAKKHHKDGLTGIPTGFSALDRLTSGWQNSDLVIIAARPGMGKCLGKGTKVLMYDGSLKKVEDIQAGELLMGDDSTPRKVLSTARGRERMYWIRQNIGIDYRVNESHILSLKCNHTEDGYQQGEITNLSVRDYLQKTEKFKANFKGYKVAVRFDEKPLPVDPYYLGVWLDEGDVNSPHVTVEAPEIIQAIEEYGKVLNEDVVISEYDYAEKHGPYTIATGYHGKHEYLTLQSKLRKLNLLGNKHIPQEFLINSTKNRMQLLAGLIDACGECLEQTNGYEIVQSHEGLARQIKFLCDTLGFRVSMRKKKASVSGIGLASEVYCIRIYGDIRQIPVRIAHKKLKMWENKVDWQLTGIQVEFDKEDDYYGFEIDGNSLFLLEDATVTHNTAFILSAMRNAAIDFEHPVAIFSLEMSSVQLVNRLISAEAELESEKIKRGTLADYEWEQLVHKTNKLTEAPIFIDDTPALSIREFRSKCRRLKAHHEIKLIIVDYLQLMSGDSSKHGSQGNREQEIASISRAMKNIAKELNVPVIALSQLSRAVETRGGDKRPQLSDLRESGCLTGDTLIQLADTGERIPIKVLAEREIQKPVKILANNGNHKVTSYTMSKVFYSGQKMVYELQTRSGRKIKASANHPFLKLNGWHRLDELTVGDRIAVPRKINITHPVNPVSTDELVLLAHLIGNGCILPKQPYHYTSQDNENMQAVCQAAHTLFNIEARIVKQKNWAHAYLPSPYRLTHGKKHPITLWYEKLGLERVRACQKKLPDTLFQCDVESIALFLKHLWATDGNISWKKSAGRKDAGAIYYATTSPVLAEQVQHLLLRLGILSQIREVAQGAYQASYQVHISGVESQLDFLKKVGCYGERGYIVPALIRQLEEIHPNTNKDVIPKEAWRFIIAPCKEESQLSWRTFAAGINTQYCGAALFKNGISRERMWKIYGILPFETIKNLADSDIFWDEIVAITPLGVEDVYDATVDEVHNFVANDIIVHNSIEQDADMVIFLYRPEYYNLNEDEMGQPTQGVGEVIIAKHRNGSLDTVKLRFIGKYTKFTNLEDDRFLSAGNYGRGSFSSGSSGGNFITLGSKANPPDDPEKDKKDKNDDLLSSDGDNIPF